ncbi:hypothetical protein FO519_003222 [Halicephalobus sp. NKZ332]|nr:hypothetical protein FO519_003222 [Halicephalobus sp. NKZ332]
MAPNSSGIIPPSRISGPIRVPQVPCTSTSNSPAISRLAPPTRISITPSHSSKGILTKKGLPSPSPIVDPRVTVASGSRLKPPGTVSNQKPSIQPSILPKAPSSTSQKTSIQTSIHSTASSSNTYASIQSGSSSSKEPQKSLKPPSKIASPSVPRSKPPATGSAMLKLFSSKEKSKKPEQSIQKSEISGPILIEKKVEEKPSLRPPSVKPQEIKKSLLQPPKSLSSNIGSNIKDNQRQEESLQTSILVSPKMKSEMTTPSTSTHSPSDFDDSGIHSDASCKVTSTSPDLKPTLAVKGMASKNQSLSVNKSVNKNQSQIPAVGIVSPILASKSEEKVGNQKEKKTDVVESPEIDSPTITVDDDFVVAMKPLKINELPGFKIPTGPLTGVELSEIGPKRISEVFSEGESLVLPDTPTKISSNSGYKSASEVAMYARRIRSTFENSQVSKRKPEFSDSFEDSSSISSGISENFEDLSTDDLTGSSVCEFPMAAAAARSASEYHGLGFRANPSKLPNPLPSSQRQSRNNGVFQNVPPGSGRAYSNLVPKLALSEDGETLSISKNVAGRSSFRQKPLNGYSSQMTSGTIGSHSAHSSPYHSQSLDRHGHMKSFAEGSAPNSPYRLSIANQNLPPHSPRSSIMSSDGYQSGRQSVTARETRHTSTQRRSSSLSYSANSGMSKSMVLFETADGAVFPLSGTALSIIENGNKNFGSDPVSNVKQSPRFRRTQMAAVEIDFGGSVPSTPARTKNGSFSARSESSDLYANFHGLQLHKLSNVQSPLSKVHRNPVPQTTSELSLASIGTNEERYEAEIRKLNYELENYRSTVNKLTAKHENYHHMIQTFDTRLQLLVRHVGKLNQKSQLKEEEVDKLKSQIDYLRSLGSCSNGKISEGLGDMRRHPSMESVASHKSSMSTSSKSSKNGFSKNSKKSWIRSSFSKAFHKKKSKNGAASDVEQSPLHGVSLQPIAGSMNQLEECGLPPEVQHLKKELRSRDEALTDIRLDALDKAREVDILRETIARLANENKMLKRNCTLLARRIDSRTSSRQSISTCQDEDPVYDPLPTTAGGSSSSHMSERSFSSTSSSKRSSGGLATRVCISLEPGGSLEFTPHQHELTIGSIPQPTEHTTWMDIDNQLTGMLKDYLRRIDITSEKTEMDDIKQKISIMGIDIQNSIIGYRVGTEVIRNRNGLDLINPSQSPSEVISPSTTIRIRLRGVSQKAVDGLIIESLFPQAILENLIRLVEISRRIVIYGGRGIGKSNLAKTLAKYFSIKNGEGKPESIVDVRYPDDEKDKKFLQVQQNLQTLLKAGTNSILLIDNVQRKSIPHLLNSMKFSSDQNSSGPIVICTVNGALQRQLEEMQGPNYGFRSFHLTHKMDAVREFMGRYLRRRIAEAELTGQCRCREQLENVIEFLGKTLSAINTFIEKANAHDETIGPRTFVQCPLSVEASRDWFIRLWNENLVPYMIRAAKEGMILGFRGQLKDPTEFVLEHWPWPDAGESKLLQRVVIEPNKLTAEFDPILALERIEESRKLQEQLHAS